VITADARKPISDNAAVQVSEEDFLRDGPVVSELVLVSIRIDILQALAVVFH
jgi:hypothetical protein